MANAIKKISVQRGYDVSEYVLATFGGAGGQHACAVADALGITRVLIHPLAGVLSAYGIGLADVTAMRELAVEEPLSDGLLPHLEALLERLDRDARAELIGQGVPAQRTRSVRRAHLRYDGTDSALPVQAGPARDMLGEFEEIYQRRFSFLMRDRRVVVEAVSVEATGEADAHDDRPASAVGSGRDASSVGAGRSAGAHGRGVAVYVRGSWIDTYLRERDELQAGDVVKGPAIIAEANATTVVEPGWSASINALGHLMLSRVAAQNRRAAGTAADPVLLEIFNNLFMSIAEQMGFRLQSTAHSVNIKERLDFSCALFDAEGNLIANAPHIPVHLGSMSESIKQVIKDRGRTMRPGDVFVLNAPYNGGTHLPDVTVIAPVFLGSSSPPPAFAGAGSRGPSDFGVLDEPTTLGPRVRGGDSIEAADPD